MSNTLIAKQFTPIYDEKEDRLRLIVNINYPTRYDIWITRKFLIDIIDNLQNYLNNFEEEKELKENKSENNSSQLPIYEATNTPSLLETLNIKKENNLFILTLQDENKTTIESVLTLTELKNLLKTLVNPVQMKWGIVF